MSTSVHTPMPEIGRPAEQILQQLQDFRADDPDYKQGKLWSLVYYLDQQHDDFLRDAYHSYSSENGLNPTAFKSLKRFETQIIGATAELLNGTEDVCGVVTSGGTESCLMAVKTYRDMARQQRKVRRPEMILAPTAHVAWFKASEYFGVKVRRLPLTDQYQPNLGKLPKLINRNTIMVLGSAPEYPHGTIDPIAAMADITQARGIPLHVDACVGGFILPFMAMNGEQIPPWDYRVAGVTSISADIHKYGYAAKGASTITYRNLDILKHQIFVHQDWPGGIFASSGLLGTRPGGAYAAAWSTLQYFGKQGYRKLAADTCEAVAKLKLGITDINGLAIVGTPVGPLFAYRSTDADINIYAVGDQMDARGWQVNRNQSPAALHAMVTARHLEVVDQYLSDLRHAVATVRSNPQLAERGGAATYGMLAHIPLRGVIKQKVRDMYAELYRAGGGTLDLQTASERNGNGPLGQLAHKLIQKYIKRKSR